MTFSYYIAMTLVLWVGGQRVLAGTATIGELTQFLAFMTVLQMPIRQIGMLVNGVARASVSGERMFEILDLEPEKHTVSVGLRRGVADGTAVLAVGDTLGANELIDAGAVVTDVQVETIR